MPAYIVGYDVSSKTPGAYENLIKCLKAIPGSVDIVESMWLFNDDSVNTNALSLKLKPYIRDGAKIIILKAPPEIIHSGLTEDAIQKIKMILNPMKR